MIQLQMQIRDHQIRKDESEDLKIFKRVDVVQRRKKTSCKKLTSLSTQSGETELRDSMEDSEIHFKENNSQGVNDWFG